MQTPNNPPPTRPQPEPNPLPTPENQTSNYRSLVPKHNRRRGPSPSLIAVVVTLLALVGWFVLRSRDGTDPIPTSSTQANTASQTTTQQSTDAPTTTTFIGQYTPAYEEGRCSFTLATTYDYECGWLVVPEDRQNPDNGREVRIHVAIFRSAADQVEPDPVVYLDGGPGGESLDGLIYSFATVWEPFLANRDLIMFDQRGVGYSTPTLECPEETEYTIDLLHEDLPNDEERQGTLDVLETCRDRLISEGSDLTQYNSAENAADVADLRKALEYEEWNLLGISYGTRLAETVMRDYPEGVRSVVLDSTYPPEANLIVESPKNFDRALQQLWAGCNADPDCATNYPNLEQRFYAVLDQYDTEPQSAEVQNLIGGGSWNVLFTGDTVMGTVHQGLYSERTIPLLPQMIAELEQGELTTIRLLTSNTLANSGFFSLGMHMSVQCNEEATFTTRAEIDTGLDPYPRLRRYFDGASNIGGWMLDACDLWQAGDAHTIENEPVVSDIPTLVLAGAYDPITPPRWGEAATARFSQGTFALFPSLGHGASVSGDCPRNIVFAFWGDPTATPDTSCAATMAPVDFEVPNEIPAKTTLIPFEEDFLGTRVTGVVPEEWTSAGLGAYARGSNAIDETAILQQVSSFGSADEFRTLLADQLNITGPFDRIGSRTSALGEWDLYVAEFRGLAVDLATQDLDQGAALVLLISYPDERDLLYEDVYLPAVDAISTGP